MPAKLIMIQGTASSVGKSILVAALCRIFHQDGYRVAPFKAQNMALNSFVTNEGGEIGRAQAVQAEAANIESSVHMNPVLLKPEGNTVSQLIVLGKAKRKVKAAEYYQYTPQLLKIIENSLNRLRSLYDIVVIEGAGSPAEINFRDREIANMRIAKLFKVPVLLVADIDRGGVFASLVGTLHLLSAEERRLVKGFIINKFRGDANLLKPGFSLLKSYTKKPILGVVPYINYINLAQEDSVFLNERPSPVRDDNLQIAVIRLPHISNYDDFDPFEQLGCAVHYVSKASELDDVDLIIIPGTKTTVSDLCYIKSNGIAAKIVEKANAGVPVIGICGGYQMLGKKIIDLQEVESEIDQIEGLGLLDHVTSFIQHKTTNQIKAKVVANSGLLESMTSMEVHGYEIHMGHSQNCSCDPVFEITVANKKDNHFDGSISKNGLIMGTYIHGLFHSIPFTDKLLNRLRILYGKPIKHNLSVDRQVHYEKLADIVRETVDIKKIYQIIARQP